MMKETNPAIAAHICVETKLNKALNHNEMFGKWLHDGQSIPTKPRPLRFGGMQGSPNPVTKTANTIVTRPFSIKTTKNIRYRSTHLLFPAKIEIKRKHCNQFVKE